jgi:hypothetical protein
MLAACMIFAESGFRFAGKIFRERFRH